MNSKVKYSKELLEALAKDCVSVSGIIRKLGLKEAGGNHSHINSRIIKYGIDTSHFTGMLHSKGKKIPVLKANEILVFDRLNGRRDSARILKRALIESGIEHKCEQCGLPPIWNGKPITLQIDHRDGNGLNNLKENLRFICPNCHSQTENYGAKNIAKCEHNWVMDGHNAGDPICSKCFKRE